MHKGKLFIVALMILPASLFFQISAYARSKPSWSEFVQQLRSEALQQGIRPRVFDRAFRDIKAPNRKVLRLDRTQPEKRLTFLKYRNTRADAYRIKLGRREIRKYSNLLGEVSRDFGVSPCFIVSLWGLETSYGRYMGNFPVISSLATLAYDNRRAAFFRKQLFYALHILNGDHVRLKDFKGEWAGASGQPQFLPSSWHHFAVDYNRDGRKDIWKTHADVFASIANYLVKHGWKTGQPWALQVSLSPHFDHDLLSRKVIRPVNEWLALGVRIKGRRMPNQNLSASIIQPHGGPTFMIFNNFRVLMKWNHSTYYAGTVGYMAEKVCYRKL